MAPVVPAVLGVSDRATSMFLKASLLASIVNLDLLRLLGPLSGALLVLALHHLPHHLAGHVLPPPLGFELLPLSHPLQFHLHLIKIGAVDPRPLLLLLSVPGSLRK